MYSVDKVLYIIILLLGDGGREREGDIGDDVQDGGREEDKIFLDSIKKLIYWVVCLCYM